MKNLVNDEIRIPEEMMKGRWPTQNVRIRDVGAGRCLLEQFWFGIYEGDDGEWVPVSFVKEGAS